MDTRDALETSTEPVGGEPAAPPAPPPSRSLRHVLAQAAVALACALLGFLLVAQVRATENLGERLEGEREEDLAQILADLSAQTDRLQSEYTELQLTLLAFESTAENEALARRSLQRRLDELRILAGVVPAEGEGIMVTVTDPGRAVTQELMVDAIQELRDAGAEALAVNDVRLVASSAFVTRNGRLVVDGQPLDPPYRIAAVGPADTMAKALEIPGGAVDSLESVTGVSTTVEQRAQITVPARAEPVPFVFGDPVPSDQGP